MPENAGVPENAMSDSAGENAVPPTYPEISVVVATRDRPGLLERAVAGILGQDYPGRVECVVAGSRRERSGRSPRRTTAR